MKHNMVVQVLTTLDSYKIEYTNFQESKDNAIGFLCDDLWKTFRELGIDFHGDLYRRFYMNYYGKDVFIGDNYWSILDHTTNRTYQGIFFTYDDTDDLGTTPAINEYVFSEIRDGDIYFKEKESDKDFVIDTTKSRGSSGWCKFRQ